MSDEFNQSTDDKKPRGIDWTAVFAIAILVVATITMIAPMVFGVGILGIEGQAGAAKLLESFEHSPLAPFEVVAAVVALSLTGFPMFLLIGAAAAIFGSVDGFIYSWIGSMIGASLGFWIGRISGGTLVKRYGGKMVRRASELLGRRGIVASALVRLVPSGPAIMVNMIAGASHMRFWQFAVGTGIGSIPKMALFAFVGGHLGTFLRGRDPVELVLAAAALVGSVVLGMWLRARFLKSPAKDEPSDGAHAPRADPPPSNS
ncbi:MAG: TVP38/TMEM64 family protein [Alphaproteobacteria bacterium]